MDVKCAKCRQGFIPEYEWQKKCWNCFFNSIEGAEWKARKEQQSNGFNWEKAKEDDRKRQQEQTRQEEAYSRQQQRDYHGRFAAPVLDKDFLRKLIMLCHPDKHGGSTMSNEVTQKLLQMKEKL